MSDVRPDDQRRTGSKAGHGRSRRDASYLYGLIISGVVLATAPAEFRLARVALSLFATLVIYWAAETYVHWIAARTQVRRPLTPAERHVIVRDGWPLVSACGAPLVLLTIEGLLQVETGLAIDLALGLNALLLFAVGWRMGRAGGLSGIHLVQSAGAAGLLGIALVGLKIAMH
jgi:hypothetical protein